jgi:heme/copper-type cytochrome/quinol oxidase subunit 4
MENPLKLIVIGFVLLIIGVVLPFLIVINLVESTLFLNFVAVACSIAGLTTGFMGITQYFRSRR